jgi:hypothetical protein
LPSYDPKETSSDAGSDDEADEPQVPISVTGPSVACADARTRILSLISSKVSQSTTSIKTIPSSYYPFIAGPKGAKARQLEEELGEGQVKVHVPPPAVWKALEKQAQGEGEEVEVGKERDLSIKVRGDKEKVKVVVAEILRQFEELVRGSPESLKRELIDRTITSGSSRFLSLNASTASWSALPPMISSLRLAALSSSLP